MKKKSFLLALAISVSGAVAFADSPTFDNLSESDFESVMQDFAGAEAHTSVSPASTLGDIFGIELGAVVGAAEVPGIEDFSKEADPNAEVTALPYAALLGAVTLPLGFKGELMFLPSQSQSGVEFKYTSIAAQWTMTKALVVAPFDMALKAYLTKAEIGFEQTISGTLANVDVVTNVTGLQFIASRALTVFEPYAGIGIVNQKGEMSFDGPDGFGYTTDSSDTSKTSGRQVFLGFNLNLLIMKLGLEVGKIFDAKKAALKVSFYF